MSKHILIVGASRGIGLGLAKEFKSRGWQVTGTERSKGDDLHALDDVAVETVDVTDPSTFSVDGEFDAVIVNAGIKVPFLSNTPATSVSISILVALSAAAIAPAAVSALIL